MKKNTESKIHTDSILRGQKSRQDRKRLIKEKKGFSPEKRTPIGFVAAPSILDLYFPKNHNKTTEFLRSLRAAARRQKKVHICFRNTKAITASGGIIFRSELDRLVTSFGAAKFKILPPQQRRDKYGHPDPTVESVLIQIGTFKLLNQSERKIRPLPANVDCWNVECGTAAEGSIAGTMLKAISARIPNKTRGSLYRGAIEALSNCVEHAYRETREDGLNIEDKRWWMFTSIQNNRLIVLVCDLGVGIPNTIRDTQEAGLIQLIFEKFGFKANSDASWIKTATLVKETRTKETNRGKGGGDLRNLVSIDKSAVLSIFSNKGQYRCSTVRNTRAETEILLEHKHSIFGTIVEWSVEMV
jgi:hypothetical protein